METGTYYKFGWAKNMSLSQLFHSGVYTTAHVCVCVCTRARNQLPSPIQSTEMARDYLET